MTIRSFAFTIHNTETADDSKALESFVTMCLLRKYSFEVMWESASSTSKVAIVEVVDIEEEDADYYSDYEEKDEEEAEDEEDSYEDYGDIEMGFNPYMGCYDYDC